MEKLSDSWITDDMIDFEYKKYILLSYFQTVSERFNRVELYPSMADLVHHYRNLVTLKNNKDRLYDNFPKTITKADFEKLELVYNKLVDDSQLISEIEDIMSFAEPLFKSSLEEGKEIYEYVESKCEVSPIGLVPLYADEGYLFIDKPLDNKLPVYKYQIKIINRPGDSFRGVHISLIEQVKKSVGQTYEQVKRKLIKKFRELPNPATFLINSDVEASYSHTLEPIAKRMLVKYIATTNG